MKRKDAFFGLHFDMHATENDINIGENFDEQCVEKICCEIQPDYIQVDAKGHVGVSSYPTKVGFCAPNIKKDILKAWREITQKYGILLLAHYSGVFDSKQCELHPEWGLVNEEGKVDGRWTSLFGEYAEKLLIPQLIEIANDYHLDGAWIDGESWGVYPDYSECALKAYGKPIPKYGEDGYKEYQYFLRRAFVAYVKNYVSKVKEAAPNFELTSNWMNSTQMPEEDAVTDFISGDMWPVNCIDFSRLDCRVVASYKRDWDLMAWGFRQFSDNIKPTIQLKQEAASVIMLGGGFQVYNKQDRKGSVLDSYNISSLKEIAKFCRDRQSFCHKASFIPEVGVVCSHDAYYHNKKNIFAMSEGSIMEDIRGILCALLDNQRACEVLMPWNLQGDLTRWSLLILPNFAVLESEVKAKLLDYVEKGGTLIVYGTDTFMHFKEELKIKECAYCDENQTANVSAKNMRAYIKKGYLRVKSIAEVCSLMNENTPKGQELPALLRSKYGKGEILGIPFNFGMAYDVERNVCLREFLAEAMQGIDFKLRVCGSHYVDPALMSKNGKTYIHLLNTHGEHRTLGIQTYDEIPSIYNVCIEYKTDKRPETVRLLPENIALPFTYENGVVKTVVEKLEIHSAIEL